MRRSTTQNGICERLYPLEEHIWRVSRQFYRRVSSKSPLGGPHWRSTSGECPDNYTGECPASPHWGSYSPHWRSTSGECPDNFTGEFPARPHWGSYPSSGYGIIEPTCHVQAICIAVPGAASAYRLHSVDCKGDTARFLEVSYPTFWNVKAVLIFQAKPAVRAPICVCM